ncbi:MAG: hypothetical protein A2600_01015 [Candidatus Lambdaproteobacteria bacterium RIFOXYD1_FULL_56_27]|uniref:Methyltransferase type 11 domain-containing protein n=1 Tax=Candidatus Lambdaproteobacteria bacterium RIFOXYD2_FULL_56_26 TaxID=1817773 RepID=A0A1F6GS53_9PROT|nr:MAG: hypothetical protein A2557_00130 [Candidatus Lambdaproteobacteria bacterium RIFOXYD2_FULL_56_26]OGH01321.1 MAG: hypothetical protein A2426_12965 [Candidatus Lambdaproteobacteria bacterium RIFOXYC1_FULL_56_13]OGH06861.1 MAG: hypothetical protein A2600_01015 [Candidatus Lambdaproteobacteria bacterium RIFOXYD1_FULL_56_27]
MEDFYRQTLYPWLMDQVMGGEPFAGLRKELLAPAAGRILELGLGTGLNLGCYPQGTTKIESLDPSKELHQRALPRIRTCGMEVEHHFGSASAMPFADLSFDYILSSWTLCSVSDLYGALREIKRVLKKGGIFRFIEHGAHPNPKIKAWQDRLNPLHHKLSGGCNLNRDFHEALMEQGFLFEKLECWQLESSPAILGYQYFGTARRLF